MRHPHHSKKSSCRLSIVFLCAAASLVVLHHLATTQLRQPKWRVAKKETQHHQTSANAVPATAHPMVVQQETKKVKHHQDEMEIQPTEPLTTHPPAREVVLLSPFLQATADVHGNLGDPNVVLSPKVGDWLKDRWQAAKDMSGTPIKGNHWITLSPRNHSKRTVHRHPHFVVDRVVLDWETAHAKDYDLQRLRDDVKRSNAHWENLDLSPVGKRMSSRKHNIDTLSFKAHHSDADGSPPHVSEPLSAIRLFIHKPGTQWGSSLWRFEVWGYFVS